MRDKDPVCGMDVEPHRIERTEDALMRKLWLTFAQAVTVGVAVLFIVATFRHEWLPGGGRTVTIQEVAQRPEPQVPGSLSAAAKSAGPSVVNIFTSKEVKTPLPPFMQDPQLRRFFGDLFPPERQKVTSLGSGVIVSAEGYILTNNHVVEAADEIEVALADGRKTRARIVGTDPESDLAVLKIDLPKLAAITFGRAEQAQVGDFVLAIGNPFGVGQTVTMGIISALGRSHLGINVFENFIQTDAPINPGNSGGALVDASGNLIGINSAIFSQSGGSMGIGFAIPVSLVKQVMEQIIRQGRVIRGWIGVAVQDLTPELAASLKLPTGKGALIAGVMEGGPADRAGVKPGDLVLEIDGKPVEDSSALLNIISAIAPGESTALKLFRGGSEVALKVSVGKRPALRRAE